MSYITNLNPYHYQQNINVSISGDRESVQTDSNSGVKTGSEHGLQNGDIIQGEIVETDGSQVKLMLNEGMVLTARLEQEIQLLLGQKMIFAVRGGKGSQISLSPLFENMSKQETGSTALKEAGLPINDMNLKLVSLLMQEGMSIDKSTLVQMSRQIGLYPDVPIEELVQINKLGLPVNEANISQFQQYTQNNHQLLQTISDVIEQIPDSYMLLAGQDNIRGANQMLIQILQTFESEDVSSQQNLVKDTDTIITQNQDTDSLTISKPEPSFKSSMQAEITEVVKDTMQAIGTDKAIVSSTGEIMEPSTTDSNEYIMSELPLNRTEMKELLHNLKQLGIDETTLKQMEAGRMDSPEIIRTIRRQIQSGLVPDTDISGHLLKSLSFKKVLHNAIEKQWLMEPQDLLEEKGVMRFYERLEKQTRQLLQGIEQNHLEQTPFAKAVQNMHANMNFMNDMNHMFAYIQLPLKLSQSNANSELYVYTNKKSLAKRSGDIRALLHLDMDHIGMVDIHIVLQNGEKVSTNFKVQDEEILDLLDSHMDELNRRLADKGYNLSSHVQICEVDRPVMQEILQDNKSSVPIAMYTFDARA